MKTYIILAIAVVVIGASFTVWSKLNGAKFFKHSKSTTNFYSLSSKTLDNHLFLFKKLKGKRILIVNTASSCKYTPQYESLQKLHEEYAGENFVILGFPCNDFGNQESKSAGDIGTFCKKNYGVSFPMMEKVKIASSDQSQVYRWLTHKSENGVSNIKIAWNFHKFLIDENGNLVASLRSGISPLDPRIIDFAKGGK